MGSPIGHQDIKCPRETRIVTVNAARPHISEAYN